MEKQDFEVVLTVKSPKAEHRTDYSFKSDKYEPSASTDLMICALNLAMEEGLTTKDCKKMIERAFMSTRFNLPKKKLKIKIGRKK